VAAPRTVWAKLKASGSLAKGLLLDEIVSKADVETPLGTGFLECQLRESGASGERYLVLKSTGGEATVFVPLDKSAAEQLVHFIELSFLKSSTS
jgi:hypothetical protein